MKKLLAFAVFFLLVSCEIPEAIKTINEDQEKELSELNIELSEQAKTLSACQADSDCSVVGFTPKACGGYLDFLVASQRSNKDGTLSSRLPSNDYLLFIGRLRSYQNRLNDLNDDNGYSTCDWIEPPRGRCVENKCSVQSYMEFDPSLLNNE
ncbi:MAG: hypothetical protein R3A80_07015 [Bdellovibrionota bacterium]